MGYKASLSCQITTFMIKYLRFRWVVCQLKALRRSFSSAIRRSLDGFLKSLDARHYTGETLGDGIYKNRTKVFPLAMYAARFTFACSSFD